MPCNAVAEASDDTARLVVDRAVTLDPKKIGHLSGGAETVDRSRVVECPANVESGLRILRSTGEDVRLAFDRQGPGVESYGGRPGGGRSGRGGIAVSIR